jgi:hypothetical protein
VIFTAANAATSTSIRTASASAPSGTTYNSETARIASGALLHRGTIRHEHHRASLKRVHVTRTPSL